MQKRFVLGLVFLALFFTGTGIAQDQNVAGTWNITITFIRGTGHHTAIIKQEDNKLSGTYKGEFLEGNLRGTVEGNKIDFSGRLRHEATGVNFHYTGTIDGDTMKGTVEMGEYWTAEWTAKKKK